MGFNIVQMPVSFHSAVGILRRDKAGVYLPRVITEVGRCSWKLTKELGAVHPKRPPRLLIPVAVLWGHNRIPELMIVSNKLFAIQWIERSPIFLFLIYLNKCNYIISPFTFSLLTFPMSPPSNLFPLDPQIDELFLLFLLLYVCVHTHICICMIYITHL